MNGPGNGHYVTTEMRAQQAEADRRRTLARSLDAAGLGPDSPPVLTARVDHGWQERAPRPHLDAPAEPRRTTAFHVVAADADVGTCTECGALLRPGRTWRCPTPGCPHEHAATEAPASIEHYLATALAIVRTNAQLRHDLEPEDYRAVIRLAVGAIRACRREMDALRCTTCGLFHPGGYKASPF